MTAQFVKLIDAVKELPKARRVMSFSRSNDFAIKTIRNRNGEPRFVIAMYHRDVNNPMHFRGHY